MARLLHVVWDWNGTLLADLPVTVESVNHAIAAHGVEPIDADGYRDHYRRPVSRFYERLLDRSLDPVDFAELSDRYHHHYHRRLHRAPLAAGVHEALSVVRRRGVGQSLLSMWSHDRLRREVDRRGLDGWFHVVDGCTETSGAGKREALERHIDRLSIEAHHVLVVGDAVDDAVAARQNGASAVLFDSGTHHRTDLLSCGVPVVSHLREIAELL